MNISGVLVHARPENAEAVKQGLLAFAGVEVHAVTDEGRLVVTLEDEDVGRMADTVVRFQDVAGVISVAMIYHHYEDEDEQSVNEVADPVVISCTDSVSEEASK